MTLMLTAPRALVGEDLEVASNAVVVIDGASIVAAGSCDTLEPPAGARVERWDGVTLVPGFIDLHVHIGLADAAAVLAGGITAARDLAWPPERIWPLVEESRRPGFAGPLLFAAGQMLTAPGGYPTRAAWAPPGTGLEVGSPAAAEDAVARQAEAGACVIKIALNPVAGPVLDDPTLEAIVAAAHRRGLRVTGHVYGVDQLRRALSAGVDELAHMLMSQEHIPDDLIARMVAAGTTIVTTLSIRTQLDLEIAVDNTRRFAASGGLVLYGTDLGNAGPRPGIDRREVAALARAGLSPLQVIRSATIAAASYLGYDGGALAPGRRADVVALGGEPHKHHAHLCAVKAVWRAGERVR
jgi:imidazolonepropionase-like amidohydrolase